MNAVEEDYSIRLGAHFDCASGPCLALARAWVVGDEPWVAYAFESRAAEEYARR